MSRLISLVLIASILAGGSCSGREKPATVLAITNVHPRCVGENLGAEVTIDGRGFDARSRVVFGKTPAVKVVLATPTRLVATLPASSGDSSIAVLGADPDDRAVLVNGIHRRPASVFDPNGDCSVSTADAIYINQYVANHGPPPVLSGDANGDGHVDADDSKYLLRYLYEKGPAPKGLDSGKPVLSTSSDVRYPASK